MAELRRYDLLESMGRVASVGDNTLEPFFSSLQHNFLNRPRWTTREDLRVAIVTLIERTHHHRPRAGLGRLTRIECETILTTEAALAA